MRTLQVAGLIAGIVVSIGSFPPSAAAADPPPADPSPAEQAAAGWLYPNAPVEKTGADQTDAPAEGFVYVRQRTKDSVPRILGYYAKKLNLKIQIPFKVPERGTEIGRTVIGQTETIQVRARMYNTISKKNPGGEYLLHLMVNDALITIIVTPQDTESLLEIIYLSRDSTPS